MDTSQERRRKKRWPEALKREIVAATLQPGASVSVIARQYDVNANQVFSWRRQYRELIARPPPDVSKPGLVAVTIAPDPAPEAAAPLTPGISDAIEIEVCGTYRIRVGSNFDCRALKRVLDVLRRR
jgi:transposase